MHSAGAWLVHFRVIRNGLPVLIASPCSPVCWTVIYGTKALYVSLAGVDGPEKCTNATSEWNSSYLNLSTSQSRFHIVLYNFTLDFPAGLASYVRFNISKKQNEFTPRTKDMRVWNRPVIFEKSLERAALAFPSVESISSWPVTITHARPLHTVLRPSVIVC